MLSRHWWTVLIGLAMAPPVFAQERCPERVGSASVRPSPERVDGAEPVTFKTPDGVPLRLHVFRPASSGGQARSAVVLFYGGGWMGGDVTQLAQQARYLAQRGAIAILADYRTYCRNGVTVDAEVQDAIDALGWIRGHAQSLAVDPRRIAALGGSSGGHLALAATMFGGAASRPDLLLLFYPCVDLTSEFELQYSAKAIGARGRDLSPLHHIRGGLPPMFVFQGSEDPLRDENRRFCKAVRVKGNRCSWQAFAGAKHGFFAPGPNSTPETLKAGTGAMDNALTRSGYLPSIR